MSTHEYNMNRRDLSVRAWQKTNEHTMTHQGPLFDSDFPDPSRSRSREVDTPFSGWGLFCTFLGMATPRPRGPAETRTRSFVTLKLSSVRTHSELTIIQLPKPGEGAVAELLSSRSWTWKAIRRNRPAMRWKPNRPPWLVLHDQQTTPQQKATIRLRSLS